MPHHTGEFPAPDELLGLMREHGVRAARMNPPSHNRYSIAPWSAGPLLQTLERHRVPLFLSGTDLGRYLDDPGTGFSPEVVHELCHTYPRLPFVILRLNFQLTRVAVALLQACPNLYADLSYHDVFLGIELLCREVGTERLLFGTGLPIGGRGAALVTLQAAEIGEGERAPDRRRQPAAAARRGAVVSGSGAVGVPEASHVAQVARAGPPYDDLVIFDNHLHFGHAARRCSRPPPTPPSWARQMSRIGIRVAVVSSIWAIFSGDVRAGNDQVLAALDRFPDRYLGYVVVHPAYPELLASELERCLRHPRMRGIKLHPTQYSHPVRITDPRYRPAFEYARDHGYPILIHTGPEAQRAYCGAEEVAKVAREFPHRAGDAGAHDGVRSLGGGGGGGKRWRRGWTTPTSTCRAPPGATTGWWSTRWRAPAARRSCTVQTCRSFTFTFPLGPVLYADIPDRAKENILGLNTARMFDIPLP